MDQLTDTIKCTNCNNNEYLGMMHWLNGKQYCRRCIANIWRKDGFKGNAFDYYYPFYSNGIDYTGGFGKK